MRFINDDFYPCIRTVGGAQVRLSYEECYRFGEPVRMHGVVDLFFDKSGGFYRDSVAPPEPDEPSGYWIELDPAIMKADTLADCDHCYL